MERCPKGIAAVKVGNLSLARQLLDAALAEDPTDVQAWLWMSGIVHTPAEKRQCLRRVLEIDPANAAAKRGLEALGPEPAAAFVADSARPQVSEPVHAMTVERKDDTAPRRATASPDRWSNLLTVALFIAVILLLILILALLANRV
ncbi:MAG TPA: hypothetical protein VFL17_15285 [Anaerolineae bacterium]|nr:hypothetical protein [Anaerolineae bacterium]